MLVVVNIARDFFFCFVIPELFIMHFFPFITYKNVQNKHDLSGSIVETFFFLMRVVQCFLKKKRKKKKFVLAQGLLGNYLLHVMPDVPCWPREQFGLMALL